ncbi:MAG: hypothetical protein AAGJ82_04345 [Bacteroidota bacterium]
MVKFFHLTMAFLLLLSSSGLVVSKHYCRGQLKSVAFFVEATPCHQNKRLVSCPVHGTMEITDETEKGCCQTETDWHQLDETQLDTPTAQLSLQIPAAPAWFATYSLASATTTELKSVDYLHYKPPLLVCDLPVRLQTFLC